MEAQLEAQKIQLKGQVDVQVAQAMHQMSMQLEQLKAQIAGGTRSGEQMFREKLETMKDDRKDAVMESRNMLADMRKLLKLSRIG